MLFTSLQFAEFFLCVYGAYILLRRSHKWQNILLLIASYVFYSFWDWRFLSLIIISTACNFLLGHTIAQSEGWRRRLFLICAVCLNLLMLAVFKYFNFFSENTASLLRMAGFRVHMSTLKALLPVGISFYTFTAMSYPIDIYRRVMNPTRSLLDFALFIGFFPYILSGPIERARRMIPQISARRILTLDSFYKGCWLIFFGLYMKLVIADNLARITVEPFEALRFISGGRILVAIYALSIQIYADFAGYSNIARGLARLMGFEIMANFRAPFFSATMPELWQRWHISLTGWIKEYLFYPLALAKFFGRHLYPAAVILIAWILFGFWHGASWIFLLWGLYHGLIIIAYNALRPYLNDMKPKTRFLLFVWRAFLAFIVFNLFSIGITCFGVKTVHELHIALTKAFTQCKLQDLHMLVPISCLVAPLFILEYFIYRSDNETVVLRWPAALKGVIYYFIFYSILIYGVFHVQKYYYFQF